MVKVWFKGEQNKTVTVYTFMLTVHICGRCGGQLNCKQ